MADFIREDLTGARFKHVDVRRCLLAILNEEWEHRLYAERDLDLLTSRLPG